MKRIVVDLSNGEASEVTLTQAEIDALPEPELIIPLSVSRAQGKAALINAGYWSQVVAYIDGIENATQKALAEVALNDTTTWQRSSPFLASAAEAVNLDEDDLDLLFIAASQIQL